MEKEKLSKTGKIIVITGPSGAGKDFVIDTMFETLDVGRLGLTRVVTHATRSPRLDKKTNKMETHGVEYFFCTEDELTLMHLNGELAEEPVKTGPSRKGTSKQQLLKVLEGQNVLWRIDLTLAEKIAKREYFENNFDTELADLLSNNTMVVYVDVELETLEQRWADRQGEGDTAEFLERVQQEREIVSQAHNIFEFRLPNPTGLIDQTVRTLYDSIQTFMIEEKI